jgi:hypothetical protein
VEAKAFNEQWRLREVAEAELRETAEALEMACARMVKVEVRLSEATALLEQCRDAVQKRQALQKALVGFLSRTPAQPAAQAWHVRGKSVELGPAAPEPDMPEDQRTLIDSYLGQPAAPEPSAVQCEECSRRRWPCPMCRPILKERADGWYAIPPVSHAEHEAWQRRAQAAESQLAAVRRVVEDYGDDVPEKAIYLIRLQLDMSRTPAPSPGAGQEGGK